MINSYSYFRLVQRDKKYLYFRGYQILNFIIEKMREIIIKYPILYRGKSKYGYIYLKTIVILLSFHHQNSILFLSIIVLYYNKEFPIHFNIIIPLFSLEYLYKQF